VIIKKEVRVIKRTYIGCRSDEGAVPYDKGEKRVGGYTHNLHLHHLHNQELFIKPVQRTSLEPYAMPPSSPG